MSNFDRGFFNNEDVSSSIKFAVLAVLNRGNADEFYRGVNKNVPVIMANFPAEYGLSSIAFDVGNESVSNGNLLIKVKENEYMIQDTLNKGKQVSIKKTVWKNLGICALCIPIAILFFWYYYVFQAS